MFFRIISVPLYYLEMSFKDLLFWSRSLVNPCSVHTVFKGCALLLWGFVWWIYTWCGCYRACCYFYFFQYENLLALPICHSNKGRVGRNYSHYILRHKSLAIFDKALVQWNQLYVLGVISRLQANFVYRRYIPLKICIARILFLLFFKVIMLCFHIICHVSCVADIFFYRGRAWARGPECVFLGADLLITLSDICSP